MYPKHRPVDRWFRIADNDTPDIGLLKNLASALSDYENFDIPLPHETMAQSGVTSPFMNSTLNTLERELKMRSRLESALTSSYTGSAGLLAAAEAQDHDIASAAESLSSTTLVLERTLAALESANPALTIPSSVYLPGTTAAVASMAATPYLLEGIVQTPGISPTLASAVAAASSLPPAVELLGGFEPWMFSPEVVNDLGTVNGYVDAETLLQSETGSGFSDAAVEKILGLAAGLFESDLVFIPEGSKGLRTIAVPITAAFFYHETGRLPTLWECVGIAGGVHFILMLLAEVGWLGLGLGGKGE